MFILWIRRSDKNKRDNQDLNRPENMKNHNEEMKRFRATHQHIDMGPARDIVTADGDLLAPIRTIRLSPNVCN